MASARSAAEPGGPKVPPDAGLTPLEVLRRLDSRPRGLLESEAAERLARYGENTVAAARPASWARRLLRTARDPFTAVLLVLGVVSAAVGAWGTAAVIGTLVAVSCVLRSAGEYRADRSAAALRELVAGTSTVQRRAAEGAAPLAREVPVEQVVPGDVVRLGPGDLVPADLRLLRADGLTVHQAALTGESAPVPKYVPAGAPAGGVSLFEQPQLCFAGTSVVAGTGTGVVTATGADTRFAAAQPPEGRRSGAFDACVNSISWTLIRFMLLAAPLVLATGALMRGRGLEIWPFAVAVAVGLTPEMLPVVVTTALVRGATELARRGRVILRRLPALHDLGAMDVLCTDKTGTLTQETLSVECSLGPDGRPDPAVLRWAAVNSLWTVRLAELPVPDPLDEAIWRAAEDVGEAAGVEVIPFDPVRRLATAVVTVPARPGRHTLVVKGAVEDVVERCVMDARARARVLGLAEQLAGQGLRLLAVATADRAARARRYTPADERGLTFTGLVGIRDTPAPTAAAALAALARRGVKVTVLTGDHPGTAARACRDLGLDPGEVVTGERIDALDDAALAEVATATTVFARCTPAHKARIVGALRRAGRTVGFLGDGVNDVPALHAADVGLCPRGAVDVTRQAADVVLAEKDLTAIDLAVGLGRRSTANIATYLRVAVSSNLGNVLSMLVAGVLVPFLPMLPAQVLVQNLCFDAAQASFAVDRPDPAMCRRPLLLRPRAFTRYVAVFGLLNSAADVATFAVLSAVAGGEQAFHTGWFTENLMTQGLVMLMLRTGRGRVPRPVRLAAAVLAAAGLLLPLSPLAGALGMRPLPVLYHLLLAGVLAAYAGALLLARRSAVGRAGAGQP
ncbi:MULTISPECIES: magnesium-translocating P-type ATPase [Streptomycetaceae]|uniref:Magnesium-transporting ATPase, P-type 1 n=1 Tax=Streptantibioticus cattleyicolor (strain ATCC 35852 / DSM 46488 / JCM 4925 / NBRC 14057 / NRRL 8057) TaxID=1003195 RepID=F8JWK5_STREN|nr:magnesium-translocating P-type ATPase [Streptantibioticus cattleyicolor]AEW95788.1 magnesium-translocating P-type ATPase [Streptantibioticus cattleyicolor NRRL 8057 = DSM 46488]MYS60331.1 magnesium-translocating P-type ATPase [Streptomyces sp. SID5468]CCB76127.1 putative magnesium-translocating P-type ATPase [Streptantibioticus cattleyicolor NRRL 8057 = DSM 46488]